MAALDASSNPAWKKITRGVEWTKAILHALACTEGDSCSYRNCKDIKSLLLHIFSSTCAGCEAEAKRRKETGEQPGPPTNATMCPASLLCQPVRHMINHWLQCQEYNCVVCITLWADILRTEQAQQACGLTGGSVSSGRSEKSCSPTPMPLPGTSPQDEALLAAAIQSIYAMGFPDGGVQPPTQSMQPLSQQLPSQQPSGESQQAHLNWSQGAPASNQQAPSQQAPASTNQQQALTWSQPAPFAHQPAPNPSQQASTNQQALTWSQPAPFAHQPAPNPNQQASTNQQALTWSQPAPALSLNAPASSCQSSESAGSEGPLAKALDQPSIEELVRCLIQKTTVETSHPDHTAHLFQGKSLWSHMLLDCTSAEGHCPFPGCRHARFILRHRTSCQYPWCLSCIPLKGFLSPEPQPQEGKRKKKK